MLVFDITDKGINV